MVALWFALGLVCGAFFSMIVMALLFVAKEADDNTGVSTGYRAETRALTETFHAT